MNIITLMGIGYEPGYIHVKALKYAICITGCTQVSQSSRRISGITEVPGWIRAKSANNFLHFLPEAGFANPIGSRNQPTETIWRVLGIPMAAMARQFPHHVKLADIVL